jgi:predicted acylesterase/phospholipase RssA
MKGNVVEAEREARAFLTIQPLSAAHDVLRVEETLRANRKFGLARKLLERASRQSLANDAPTRLRIAQKHALCTYKDPDLPADEKLDDAERILDEADPLVATQNQETLGLAGAIYKQRWELTAQERYLETSLAYYYRGYEQGVANDYGYTAINAAYVLDLLADLEDVDGKPPPLVDATSAKRRSLAREIREKVVQTLRVIAADPRRNELNTQWWFLVTLGEACFGLDEFATAGEYLNRAAALADVADWEQESTARQLASLLRIKEKAERRGGPRVGQTARAVLLEFLGRNVAALDSVIRGKIGVGLSGGGFRASLYHIGVFARLAELDLLRHVEYLSCVSGGSIVGAHLYLEIRHLLHTKGDADITREDYIEIVRRIEKDFLDGVKTNIRTEIAAEWLTNVKMIFLPGYSRTARAGDLYERNIYSRVQDGHGNKPRWLNELKIHPIDEAPGFSPKDHNWRRRAKVPILVLNATSLNTGHNWQFTASWMGEPPAGLNSEVDANYRLRRMYYSDAPEAHRRIRLGAAVAASACVPGIFEPLTLSDLYERLPEGETDPVRPIVRLVDGGVYDNQGVSALLEQGCSVLLVSDASGQMDARDFPSNSLLGVPLRANSILQARVRGSQFEQLSSRRRGGLLRGLMFVHLKKDLAITPVDWVGAQEKTAATGDGPMTEYGVPRRVQRQLAAIRTDLDSFSDVEAYALMTSGYAMTEHELRESVLGFDVAAKPRERWKFLDVEPFMHETDAASPLAKQLKVATVIFFKVWLLVRQLQIAAGIVVLAALALAGYAAWTWWEGEIFRLTVKDVVIFVVLTLLGLLGLGIVGKLANYRKTATEILIGLGMATFGFIVARAHLHIFDKIFLWYGSMRRLAQSARKKTAND